MNKNVASQKIQLFAFDISTGAPKTGDAANITAYVSKDHGAVTVLGDTSATEMDATNAKGVYLFDLTQAETNADELTFTAKSATANVSITPRFISTTPAAFTSQVAQTGDNYARLGAPVGASISADIAAVKAVLPAALVSGRIDASVGAMAANVLTATAINADAITAAKIADGAIDAATFAAGAINAAAIAADAITDAKVASDVTIASVTGAVGSVTGAVGSVTGNVGGNVVGTVASVVGAVGSVTGLTAANLDVAVSSRLATAGYTAPPNVNAIADQVWDEVIAGHLTGGTTGASLNGAGSAGDPWVAASGEGALTMGDLMRLQAAVAVGNSNIVDLGGGAATVTFEGADSATVRVTATMTGSERTTVVLTP